MNPNVFDSVLELLGLGAKVVVSQSELKPTTKEGFHFAIDMIKKFSSEINRQVETQKIRKFLDELIAHAKVCDIDRLELILLEGNRCEPLFLAFGGDYERFFQVSNLVSVSLQDDLAFAQKVSEARKQSSILIYQRQ